MPTIPYDYLDQDIQATALIQLRDNDSFFNPGLGHNGFAANGTHYTNGVQDVGPVYASWYTEQPGSYRGSTPSFPEQGLILLSKVALTILDESTRSLKLWMQFILKDSFALTNNFDGEAVGWTPRRLSYADGIISVLYEPDEGAIDITSNMVVSMDFTQDNVYLDVAVLP